MPKYICYALFDNASKAPFEKQAYVRGFYWNARMNNLIYPDWRTHLEVDLVTFTEYQSLFEWLVQYNNLSLRVNSSTPEICEGMLWRLKPVFDIDIDHVLCRDADAITTYKEALLVQEWLESGKGVHAILDNPAHGGLMGGMIGVNSAVFKGATKFNTWEEFIKGVYLGAHGADQNYLNSLKSLEPHVLWHSNVVTPKYQGLPLVNKKLWESNLTCRHIGSPGVVELELMRFFQRMDEYNWKYIPIEKANPKLFPWL